MATSREVVVDVHLTNFVREYPYIKQRFIKDVVAPLAPVSSFKGDYKELGKEALDIHVADTVGDRAKTNEIGTSMTEASYEAIERRLKILVTDREIKYAPKGFDPMKNGALTVSHALKLRQEYRVAALAQATANTAAPAVNWNHVDAVIVSDMQGGVIAFKALLGMEPNTFVCPDNVADAIAGQADIISLLQTSAALQNPWEMLTLLSGKKLPSVMMGMDVVTPNTMYNSAQPGQTRTIARIWPDNVYFLYVDGSPRGSNWARQFEATAFTILKWRNADPPGWYVKAVGEWDEVEVTSEACYELTALLS